MLASNNILQVKTNNGSIRIWILQILQYYIVGKKTVSKRVFEFTLSTSFFPVKSGRGHL